MSENRLGLRLPAELDEWLAKRAAELYTTKSALIRLAVAEMRARQAQKQSRT